MMRLQMCVIFLLIGGCDPKPVYHDFGAHDQYDGDAAQDTSAGGPGSAIAIDAGVGGAAVEVDAKPAAMLGAGGAPNAGAPDTGAPDAGAADAGGRRGSDAALGAGGAPPSTGGALGVDSGRCMLVTHTNGLGPTWQDCVPRGIWNAAQAMKACAASFGGNCELITPDISCQSVGSVSATVGDRTLKWIYEAPATASVFAGDLVTGDAAAFRCPNWGAQQAVWS